MPAQIIDGKAVAAKIMERTARQRAELDFTPGLAAVLVGDDPASQLYISLKEKACARSGIHFEKVLSPADITETSLIDKIGELNRRQDVDAILIQLPLPSHLDENKIIAALDPTKDVDGFHPENLALLLQGQPRLIPGLTAGIMELIESTGAPLADKTAAVVANSQAFFYRPVAKALEDLGVRPAFISPNDPGLAAAAAQADLLIVAVGRPKLITGEMLKPGAVVIDVGTNRVDDKVVGDVDRISAEAVAGYLTPVPGGVGPVTVAMLMANTVALAAQRRSGEVGKS